MIQVWNSTQSKVILEKVGQLDKSLTHYVQK